MRHPREWLEDAACRDVDPEIFFPLGSGDLYVQSIQRAQRVCSRCPVAVECAGYATYVGATDGVWAGRPATEFVARRSAVAYGR